MGLALFTGPSVEPLSAAEAKSHLRVDSTDEDVDILGKIVAARNQAEGFLGKRLITQTWDLYLDEFPSWEINLAKLGSIPLISVTSIIYDDPAGTSTTLSASLYRVDAVNGRITPAYGQSWPLTRCETNAIRIRHVVGYGPAANDVPFTIRSGMLVRIGTLHEHREEKVVGTIVTALDSAESYWWPERNGYAIAG